MSSSARKWIPMTKAKLVPAVMRAAEIMDHIAARQGSTLSALAQMLDLPKSSVHALCKTLCHLQLLHDQGGRYVIGRHAATWTSPVFDTLVDLFRSGLRNSPDLTGHTVTLSIRDGQDVVYQACHNSPAPLGIMFRVGMQLPMVFTATGKAMLAAADPVERAAVLAMPLPPPMTRYSVASATVLEGELAEIARTGYSVDNGQVREGMSCFGAAVRDAEGRPVAAIAVSMTTSEAEPCVVAGLAPALMGLADRLSQI